jgi:hypothetical protein
MLIKFMAQQSVWYLQIQYNTTNFYEKNLIFWFELFFTTFLVCNVPPFRILDEYSSSFDFIQSQTDDMPKQKSAATVRKISPFLIRLTASNFCSIVITTRFV